MVESRVQLVMTADDVKLMNSVMRGIEGFRKMGAELGKTKRKGKSAFDGIGKSIMSTAAGMVSASAITALFTKELELLKQGAADVNAELGKTTSLSQVYVDSFSNIMANMPGPSKQKLQDMEGFIRDIPTRFALPPGGAADAANAMATTVSAMPNAPMSLHKSILEEAAQFKELAPETDMAALALGIGKAVEANPSLSPNQAQNLVRTIQSQGAVKDAAKVADMIPKLGSVAGAAGMSLSALGGFGAWATQVSGDQQGDKTTRAVQTIALAFEQREKELRELSGVDFSGNMMDKFGSLRKGVLSGKILPEDMDKIATRGGADSVTGKMIIRAMTTKSGAAAAAKAMGITTASMEGDVVADDIAKKLEVVPGAAALSEQRLSEGRVAKSRLGNVQRISIRSKVDSFKEELRAELQSEKFVRTAGSFMSTFLMKGQTVDVEERARHAALDSDAPFFGGPIRAKAGILEAIQSRKFGKQERGERGTSIAWSPGYGLEDDRIGTSGPFIVRAIRDGNIEAREQSQGRQPSPADE